jgi:hypothetical protein
MKQNVEVLKQMYADFNARNIDGVLDALSDNVAWANGMDGGYVHGYDGVKEYWTRQWAIVSPQVEPIGFDQAADGSIIVTARQTIRDLEGKPLQNQTHGLHDKVIKHVFHFQDEKVIRFDIQDVE